MLRLMRAHRHFLIIVTLLTLVMTFPTIIYVLRTDVFWLPGGAHPDAAIKFWDVWYGKLLLSGQADLNYTNVMYYPVGVSLIYHPFFTTYTVFVNALALLLPMSNAVSLTSMLIVFSAALSAYVYLRWLFNDKWTAILGSVVFGFSPHVIGHPFHPDTAWIAPIPLVLYLFHRGIKEDRRVFVLASGLLAGLTSTVILYAYISTLIALGIYVCAFAISRWRDKRFWLTVVMLSLAVALASAWRIYPLISNSESLGATLAWHGADEVRTDAISYFVNHENPFLGQIVGAILQTPPGPHVSGTSFLGYLPLLLVCAGLATAATRRRALPWALLCAPFLILRLGSQLRLNGTVYPDVLLPKYYLDQIPPGIFEAFWEADMFMMGALLPFTVLTCFGLLAIQKRYAVAAKPIFILALAIIVAIEYYIPLPGRITPDAQVAFLNWLAQENEGAEIRLINLPLGRNNSKRYNLFQSLSGYPHAEGAISRTPDSAYDYIRANYLLNAWYRRRPVHCELADRDAYLAGLTQLDEDGFSHVVYHRGLQNWADIHDSFAIAEPSYSDDYVSIYHLNDLRESCPEAPSARQRFTRVYADALQQPSILDERPGPVVLFPPTPDTGDHFARYLRYFSDSDRTVLTITGDDEPNFEIRNTALPPAESLIDLKQYAALWLVNDRAEFDAELTAAYQDWFTRRFTFCARYREDERMTIDLYLRAGIPCAALDDSSVFAVRYDEGVRLHNLSFVQQEDIIRFYLAWSNTSPAHYAFSLQFFDADGRMALQYDHVIYRQVLTAHEIDASSLPAGAYSMQLIVYDFETQASQGGIQLATAARFERALEIGQIELRP